MIEIFGPVLLQKLCVAIGFRARTWCLGRNKGSLMSRQSLPKAGPIPVRVLSRQGFAIDRDFCRDRVLRGGVVTKSFLSRPIDQAFPRDRVLGAHTTGLGTCTSGGFAHTTDELCRDKKFSVATDFLQFLSRQRFYVVTGFTRHFFMTENSLSRQRISEHGISPVAT